MQLPGRGQGGGASQLEWRLQEDAERPEQRAVGKGAALVWDPGVEHHGSFGPRRRLLREAVAAVPAAGGAVATLLAVGVGVVVAAILDMAWTDRFNDK